MNPNPDPNSMPMQMSTPLSGPAPAQAPAPVTQQLDAERLFTIEPGLFQASALGVYPPNGAEVVLNVSDMPNEFMPGHGLVAVVHMPLSENVFPGLDWLELAVDIISRFRRKNHAVVVHCDMAESRSSLVVLAYFMRERAYSLNEALTDLQSKNPYADPPHRFMVGLGEYEKFLERG